MPSKASVQKILKVFECRSEAQIHLQGVIRQQQIAVFYITSPTSALELAGGELMKGFSKAVTWLHE